MSPKRLTNHRHRVLRAASLVDPSGPPEPQTALRGAPGRRFVPLGATGRRVFQLGAIAVLLAAVAAAAASAAPRLGFDVGRAPASGSVPAGLGQVHESRAFLPLAMRRYDLTSLPSLPTAVPSTPTATPTPTTTPAPGPTPTPPPPRCTLPLEQRITVTEVDIGRDTVSAPGSSFDRSRPILVAPVDRDRALIAWSSARGEVHVTPITIDGQRTGSDFVVRGNSVHGLAAVDGGGAVLVARGSVMALVRFDAGGEIVFENKLVGDSGRGVGAKWIDSWGHDGRLVWTGDVLAAYFGHTQQFAGGKHQGDLLWLIDAAGERVDGEEAGRLDWDWGCSHSLDARLTYNAGLDLVGSVCLSDCNPGKGIFLDHGYLISSEPSGDCSGHSDATLGGLVPAVDGFSVSYASNVGRRSLDIALVRTYADGLIGSPRFLTDTPSVNEASPHLARYGDSLLAAWKAGSRLILAVVGEYGEVVSAPVTVQADIAEWDDFANYPSGDVGWAFTSSGSRKLSNVVVEYCEQP